MKNFKGKILTLLLVLASLFLAGCSSDPTEQELTKGQNIDIERMEGEVVTKSIKHFEGDKEITKERKWKPYYCLTISSTDAGGYTSKEEFKDVPVEVFDAVYVGKKLPAAPLLTLTQLSKMEGEIVDMKADLITRTFSIVVNNLEGLHIYGVDIKTYYTLVHVGSKLPLKIDNRKSESIDF